MIMTPKEIQCFVNRVARATVDTFRDKPCNRPSDIEKIVRRIRRVYRADNPYLVQVGIFEGLGRCEKRSRVVSGWLGAARAFVDAQIYFAGDVHRYGPSNDAHVQGSHRVYEPDTHTPEPVQHAAT